MINIISIGKVMQLTEKIKENGSFFWKETLNAKISLCYIYIPLAIQYLLLDPPDFTYKYQKNILVNAASFREDIFTADEIDRLNQFKALKKQIEWICGRYAVKKLVSEAFNGIGIKDIKIAYHELGAPYLQNFSELHLSITHSHEYAIAALSSDKRINLGIDIERFDNRNFEKSMGIAFSEREKEYLAARPAVESYNSWTMKEAYLKYIKKGFHENLKNIEIIDKRIYHNCIEIKLNKLQRVIDEVYYFSAVWDDWL